jgi:hypothetical protein
MYALMSVVLLVVVIGALADIITRQEWQVKHLPKIVWVLLVVLLPLVGSILWFAVGREYDARVDRGSFGDPRRSERHDDDDAARTRTTEQELADLDREIEFHSKQAEIDRLEALLLERRPDDQAR